jgi:hypothetical protein
MDRAEHTAVDEMLLGYTDESVHAFIDNAAAWLGFGHRSVRHTLATVEYVEELKGTRAGRIALLHLLIDNRVLDRQYLEERIAEENS